MSATNADQFAHLDASGVTREQWKIMFISGMGFFCDAYEPVVVF